ncbi:enoyl-CoA hydratase [Sporosarcina sp. P16b]|nr:enoyl-CoA hydratase [Sporosarcina sp. P16b]
MGYREENFLSITPLSKTKYMTVAVKGRVATVSFNRPKSMNAFTLDMFVEFHQLLKELRVTKSIHIIIFKGNGNAFSSGADIKNMSPDLDLETMMDLVSEIAVALYTLPKVTIAAIHGAAAGGGLSLALATDYTIAQTDSKIAMNFNGIGLIPDVGAHYFLLKKLGEAKAKQVIWNASVLSASEAFDIGMIDELADDLQGAVERQVEKWLASPIQPLIQSKLIFTEVNREELIHILKLEKNGQIKMRQTSDHLEGIQAFIEKRKPIFKGE